MKNKNHMISIDAEKTFDNVQYPFMVNINAQRIGSRGSIPQHNKGHIQETYSQHQTQWAKN